MADQASLPVLPSLPHLNPTTSYWQEPPDVEISSYGASGSMANAADCVIIGSGITGASIAYRLLYPEDVDGEKGPGKIMMLEARGACSGATGRNGGHTKAASYRRFLSNVSKHGVAAAVEIARFEYANIKALHSFARNNGIDCDAYSGDTVDIIYDAGQWDLAHKAIDEMKRAMGDDDPAAEYTFWTAEDAKEIFKVRGEECLGAVSYEAGSLSAYKFVIELLKRCLSKGLELHTHTPVTQLERIEGNADASWIVHTTKGSIRAKRVMLATNGYTAHLLPELQRVITPVRGQITAQRPGKNMPVGGLGMTMSFIYGSGFEYMVERPRGSRFEGDIIMGGGLLCLPNNGAEEFGVTDDSTLNAATSKYLHDATERYFGDTWGPDDEEGRVRREWTGIMGFTPDDLPLVGEVPGKKNLWIASAFQGHGMVLCLLCVKAVVDMMVGKKPGPWWPKVYEITRERMQT